MKGRAIVTGASSGLGAVIMEELEQQGWSVGNWSLDTGIDIRDEACIKNAAETMEGGSLDLLINCAGVNNIEWLPKMSAAEWNRLMDTNARGIFYTAKYLCERLRGGTILNIVSNAARIPMTHSIAYNASKAAALMMTKQMARELGKTHNITVFSVSPTKLSDTGMSAYIEKRVCELRGWTPEEAAKYQLAALPAGEETPPGVLAEFIGFLLSEKWRHKYLQGCDITYGGPTT